MWGAKSIRTVAAHLTNYTTSLLRICALSSLRCDGSQALVSASFALTEISQGFSKMADSSSNPINQSRRLWLFPSSFGCHFFEPSQWWEGRSSCSEGGRDASLGPSWSRCLQNTLLFFQGCSRHRWDWWSRYAVWFPYLIIAILIIVGAMDLVRWRPTWMPSRVWESLLFAFCSIWKIHIWKFNRGR